MGQLKPPADYTKAALIKGQLLRESKRGRERDSVNILLMGLLLKLFKPLDHKRDKCCSLLSITSTDNLCNINQLSTPQNVQFLLKNPEGNTQWAIKFSFAPDFCHPHNKYIDTV